MTASDWVALTVGFGNALVITVGLLMARQHARQSVRPFIMSNMNFPDEDYGIGSVTLHNCGVGPAKVLRITLYRDGAPYRGKLDSAFKAAINDIGKISGIKPLGWVQYQKGFVIPKDGVIRIGRFRCTSETSDVDAREALTQLRIQIEVEYQDLYGKRFTQIDPSAANSL